MYRSRYNRALLSASKKRKFFVLVTLLFGELATSQLIVLTYDSAFTTLAKSVS